ncbi:flagellar basal body P-ring formation chaperone FlgA [Leptospira sp. 2 VSF19]|uniref:Flagellar basal body P-ring formation chaperone FlgA n=1 Tax=Leptospira soteropolitanensis TaxID=2950025 RepID=A0AAW5VHK7_9LEPT|nr:flagellar basal body P-ring formation chaperone FlgA [Leptospira soteropolitanensis]MCW7492353.1 flagellar basal body P-ring formation chaperone FlgA [Leptospira soteropolitanensis]MCW7499935.1 flagellar basal body P-ring formation chaperone FlgA [Leptospira soteropolitanensis]MCW7522186.1 flagellar basal body P-ring formation chaperone FlgA [Leptospira soteropolitanensis]MCW7526040.1 flagellar basal body P-ring formation chaperone FlgA [Leptospira soteropolitanensis]MCW7529846.1 flagellar 
MKVWFLIFFSLALSLPVLAKENDFRLYLKPKTIVGTGEIRLSDFTNWKGNWNPILFQNLQSPKVLTPEQLVDVLNSRYTKEITETGESVSFEVMGKEGMILPKTTMVSKKDLERSLWKDLKESVEQALGEDGERYRISSEKEFLLAISGTKLVWRNTGRTLHGGKRLFPLDYYFEGKMVHSESVPFLIEEKKNAYFTTREIPAKTVLTEEDVEIRSFFTADHNREYVEESPVGKTALNALLSDMTIEKKQVRTLHTIERGQEVQLVYTTGNLLLKIKTRALASGNRGDEIPVLNLASQKIIKARVQNEGICLLEEI